MMRTTFILGCALAAVVVAAACSDDTNTNSDTLGSNSVSNTVTPTGTVPGQDNPLPSNPVVNPTTPGGGGNGPLMPPGPGAGGSPVQNPTGPMPVTPSGGGAPSGGGDGPGGTGGTPNGGMSNGGGVPNGGMSNGGGVPNGGMSNGGQGTGGSPPGMRTEGPCDIYDDSGTPCVAAYSMVRALFVDYDGPLYQVRSGSNPENTGSGGQTHDIGMTADGFADAAAVDAVCNGTTCTVSLLYDQSGRGNHLPVAKRGLSNGGQYAALDDFETIIARDDGDDELMVGGHRVYSLYMDIRQGYRLTSEGEDVPLGQEPQGLYMLADGTHYGTACCWDFGNVSPDPTRYGVMNTLFFGTAFWGRGAGSGPWFMADYEAGVWAGGSNPGDPGWGALGDSAPPNENNPSMGVPFALGFLKTNENDWAIRMADIQTANSVTTAYAGGLPKQMNNEGAIVLGVGGDNSNNSWGTFFEGAVIAGFPSDATELAVMQNIQAVGYGQ